MYLRQGQVSSDPSVALDCLAKAISQCSAMLTNRFSVGLAVTLCGALYREGKIREQSGANDLALHSYQLACDWCDRILELAPDESETLDTRARVSETLLQMKGREQRDRLKM